MYVAEYYGHLAYVHRSTCISKSLRVYCSCSGRVYTRREAILNTQLQIKCKKNNRVSRARGFVHAHPPYSQTVVGSWVEFSDPAVLI